MGYNEYMEDVLKAVGRLMGSAMERGYDEKALAVLDYFIMEFGEFRKGELPAQEFVDRCKEVWDGAPLKQ